MKPEVYKEAAGSGQSLAPWRKADGISAYDHKLIMQATLYRRAILAYSEDLPKLFAIIPIVKRNGL
jgi:hypothetical protein